MKTENQKRIDTTIGNAATCLSENKMWGKVFRVQFDSTQMILSDEANNVWIWYSYSERGELTSFHVTHRLMGVVKSHYTNWDLPESFDELKTKHIVVAISHAFTLVSEYERIDIMRYSA